MPEWEWALDQQLSNELFNCVTFNRSFAGSGWVPGTVTVPDEILYRAIEI